MKLQWIGRTLAFIFLVTVVGGVFASSMGEVVSQSPLLPYLSLGSTLGDTDEVIEAKPAEGPTRTVPVSLSAAPSVTAELLMRIQDEAGVLPSPGAEEVTAGEAEPKAKDYDSWGQLPRSIFRARSAEVGDWRAVQIDTSLVNELRSHWVALTSDGRLVGHVSTTLPAEDSGERMIVPAAKSRVYLLDGGRVVATSVTDEEGHFELTGVESGAYSLVGMGDTAFFAYSLTLVPHSTVKTNANGADGTKVALVAHQEAQELPAEEAQLNVLALGPTFHTLRRLLTTYYRETEYTYADETQFAAKMQANAETRNLWTGVSELQQALPPAKPATSVSSHRVALDENGDFVGRLHGIQRLSGRPKQIRNVNVFVLQNDQIVARATVDDNGVFHVDGLKSGFYGLVAGGPDGFGVIGFEAAASEKVSRADGEEEFFVAAVQDQPTTFSMALVTDPRDMSSAFTSDLPGGLPLGAGLLGGASAPPSSGGGATGGGAGGGLGALGLAAPGIVAASSLNDCCDDNNLTSPFQLR